MANTAVVILRLHKIKKELDLEIPLDITVANLLDALNSAYGLKIDVSDVKNCYLKTENPIGFLKGNRTLADFGVRNGTVINITE